MLWRAFVEQAKGLLLDRKWHIDIGWPIDSSIVLEFNEMGFIFWKVYKTVSIVSVISKGSQHIFLLTNGLFHGTKQIIAISFIARDLSNFGKIV